MARPRLFVTLIGAFLLASLVRCNAQKTTVDPNLQSVSSLASASVPDARLKRNITYSAWHVPVRRVLDDLTKSTGVKLYAGYNKKDWQVRDRRMNICVTEVTLDELMGSIARVMKFKWSKENKDEQPSYRLIVDRKLVANIQAEATELDDELKREEVRRRTGLVDALAKVASLSGPDLEALRDENPYLYMCSKTGFAKMVTRMMADEPALQDAFVNADRSANVDVGLFSPTTQHQCVENVRNMWPLDHITQNHQPLKDGFADAVAAGQVCFDCVRPPREYTQSKRLFYFGSVCVHSPEDGHFLGDMRDPYAKATRAWADACLDAVESNAEPAKGWRTVAPKYFPTEEEEAKDMEPYLMFDPLVEHPDDPDLHKEVTLKLSEEDHKALIDEVMASGGRAYQRVEYQSMLKLLANASGVGIVSDSYSVVIARNSSNIPGKAELMALLDKLGDTYRLNWEKHGSTIEIRRRDWFRRRASQLPDEWLDPWRTELKRNGAPSLDTYAHMVGLAEDQIEENINCDLLLDQVVGGTGGERQNREFCRFYIQLNDGQRDLAFSADGLDLRLLSPSQRQYYANTFLYGWQDGWRTEEFVDPPEGGTVAITGTTKSGSDGSSACTFTVRLVRRGSNDRERKWDIPLRKIVLPRIPSGN